MLNGARFAGGLRRNEEQQDASNEITIVRFLAVSERRVTLLSYFFIY